MIKQKQFIAKCDDCGLEINVTSLASDSTTMTGMCPNCQGRLELLKRIKFKQLEKEQ